MKKLDGDLSARPGNFHQGLELSLSIAAIPSIFSIRAEFCISSENVLCYLSIVESESIFAASKISKPLPNQPLQQQMIFALQRAVLEYCCRIHKDLTFKHR